jgi:hypothetical protein
VARGAGIDGKPSASISGLVISNTSNSIKYHIDAVVDQPYGYANISIHATGRVDLALDIESVVPLADYISYPHKFGWWEVGRYKSFA